MDLCLRCARPIDPLQNFCPHCGAPAGYAASLPFEHELVLAQTLGMMFQRACRPSGAPLAWRAVDVFVVSWVGFLPIGFFVAFGPTRWILGQAAVTISLLLAVSALLLTKLRRRRVTRR